jgi:hypothetical protein
MTFPVIAFVLAVRGEIQAGQSMGSHVRIFLLQEESVQGIGVEWTRPAGSESCYMTTVNYLLWKGGNSASNTSYCLCHEADGSVSTSCPES